MKKKNLQHPLLETTVQTLVRKTSQQLRKMLWGGLALFGGLTSAQAQTFQFDTLRPNPFGLSPLAPPSSSHWAVRDAPCLFDFDADGDLDLMVVRESAISPQTPQQAAYSSSVLYYRNSGTAENPQFDAPITNPFSIALPAGFIPSSVAAGSLDGDGDPELVVTGRFVGIQRSSVIYFNNTGTSNAPSFAAPVTLSTQLDTLMPMERQTSYVLEARWRTNVILNDHDADGDLDVLFGAVNFFYYQPTAYYGSRGIWWYQNNTSTGIQFPSSPSQLYTPAQAPFTGSFAVADWNNDGVKEFLEGFYYGFQMLKDTGTASGWQLDAPMVLNNLPDNVNGNKIIHSPAVAHGDLDGDGDVDLLVTSYAVFRSNAFDSDSLAFRYAPNRTCNNRQLSIVTSDRIDPVLCDGAATVTVTGGSLPFVTVLNNYMPINRTTATFNINSLCDSTYTLRITDAAGCKLSTSFTINRIVGVGQVGQSQLRLTPNPTAGTLWIETQSPLAEVRVLSLEGKMIQQWFNLQTNQLELNSLPRGMYLVQVRTQDGKMLTEKLIKE